MAQQQQQAPEANVGPSMARLGFEKGIQFAADPEQEDGAGDQESDSQRKPKSKRSRRGRRSQPKDAESDTRGSADASSEKGDEDATGLDEDPDSPGDGGDGDDSPASGEDDDLTALEGEGEEDGAGEGEDNDLGDEDDPNSVAGLTRRLKNTKHLLAQKQSQIDKLRDASQRQFNTLLAELHDLKQRSESGTRGEDASDGMDELMQGNDGDVLTRADLKKWHAAQAKKAKPKDEDQKTVRNRQLTEIYGSFPDAKEINDYAMEKLAADPEFGMLRTPLSRMAFALKHRQAAEIKKVKKTGYDEGYKAARMQFTKGRQRDGNLPDASSRRGGQGAGQGGGGFRGDLSKTEGRILKIGKGLGLELKLVQQGR